MAGRQGKNLGTGIHPFRIGVIITRVNVRYNALPGKEYSSRTFGTDLGSVIVSTKKGTQSSPRYPQRERLEVTSIFLTSCAPKFFYCKGSYVELPT